MTFVTIAGLGFVLLLAALNNGAAELQVWNVCLAGVGLVAAVHFFLSRRQKLPRVDRFAAVYAGLVLAAVAIQVIPLPTGLVSAISPLRGAFAEAANKINGSSGSFISLSANPRITLNYLLLLAGYIVVFCLVRDVVLRLGPKRWIAALPLIVVGTLEGVLSLLQSSTGKDVLALGTYVSRDHFAGLLEMILPFAALGAAAILEQPATRQDTPARAAVLSGALALFAAVILAAILHSLSRGGFLAAFTGLLVAGMMTVLLRRSHGRTSWVRKAAPAAIVGIAVLCGFLFLPSNLLVDRFTNETDFALSGDTRAQIWQEATGIVKDYPLFGCGMGTFESCFLRYKTVAPMFTVDYAHNDYVQVLAELGVFGFLAGVLFLGRVLQKSIQGARRAVSSSERYLSIACIAGMVAMLLHSFVDFNMYVPANALVFAWIAGIAGAHASRSSRKGTTRKPAKRFSTEIGAQQELTAACR